MVRLVQFGPDQLLELGGCRNMQSINIGGCGDILSACAVCASVQRADPDRGAAAERRKAATSKLVKFKR